MTLVDPLKLGGIRLLKVTVGSVFHASHSVELYDVVCGFAVGSDFAAIIDLPFPLFFQAYVAVFFFCEFY